MKKQFLMSERQFYVTENMPLVADDSNCYELVLYTQNDLSDAVFTVTATRSDGESFTGVGIVDGKTARYTLDNNMYAKEGPLKVRTTITTTDKTVITANEITFEVIRGTNKDEALKADTNYPVITQLIVRIEELTGSIPAAAEKAETTAIFAQSAGEAAVSSGNAAQAVADKAKWLIEEAELVADALPPTFSQEDCGKILYLTKNGAVSDIASVSVSYGEEDCIITDAGLLDEERAFIDMSGAELLELGIADPMDDRCLFAFQLMPDSLDYTTDYDISAEEVEETDDGYRMIFPASHCEPFAENNIQSASDLFAIFEKVQFNADFPKDMTSPAWGTPDEVLPAAFLDEKIISPAVRLSKEYADVVKENAKTYTDERVGKPVAVGKGSADNPVAGFSKIILPSAYSIFGDEGEGAAGNSFVMSVTDDSGERSETFMAFAEHDVSLIFDIRNKESGIVTAINDKTGETSTVEDIWRVLQNMERCNSLISDFGCTFYYYTDCGTAIDRNRDYTDNAIKTAIMDSWEVAV